MTKLTIIRRRVPATRVNQFQGILTNLTGSINMLTGLNGYHTQTVISFNTQHNAQPQFILTTEIKQKSAGEEGDGGEKSEAGTPKENFLVNPLRGCAEEQEQPSRTRLKNILIKIPLHFLCPPARCILQTIYIIHLEHPQESYISDFIQHTGSDLWCVRRK